MYHDDAHENPNPLLTGLAIGSVALAALIYYRSTMKKPITPIAPKPSAAAAVAADAVAQMEAVAEQASEVADQVAAEAAAETVAPEPLPVDPGTPAGIPSASNEVVTPSGEVFAPTDVDAVTEPAATSPQANQKLINRAKKQLLAKLQYLKEAYP